MKIENRDELLALHRCIFEAKFNSNPVDNAIVGSPIVAELANQVLDELEMTDGDDWANWRKAEKHQSKVESIIGVLRQRQPPAGMSLQEKRSMVINALAPLIATEATLDSIIDSVFSGGAT